MPRRPDHDRPAELTLRDAEPEQLALAGFLAGSTGPTREPYALDLRQYASWCQQHHLRLFQARRGKDQERRCRSLEAAAGRVREGISRR